MDPQQLRCLLEQVRDGEIDPEEAARRLDHMPFEDLGFAKVDHHRALRHGMPEVVLGRGKTPEEVRGIAERLLERSENLL
ncbi:MAG: 1-(5-phosphoribosyl)-5-amino-4-imidazole-carboxylate carboxylase, partial [Planctomycetota bacterium]